MPLSLVEFAKTLPPGPERAVFQIYGMQHPIWEAIPIETDARGIWEYTAEQATSTTGFRGLNEGFAESTSVVNPKVEYAAICGGDIDVDQSLVDRGGPRVLAREQASKIKSLSWTIGDAFINGSSITTPKGIDGLKTRLGGTAAGGASGQILSEGATDGGDALQAASLDSLVSAVDGGASHLLMTRAMQNLITAGARSTTVLGTVNFETDSVGRKVTTWNGVPILIIDPVNAHTTSMGFNELGGAGSTATASSIYAVNFRNGGVFAFWNGPWRWNPNVPMSTPVVRARLDGLIGLCVPNPFAVARLRNISNAPMVA